ncbi:MAG: hypothetical protein MK135_14270, partial [Polyangiaceae bacterium]|nr:hypothetical protein [Polyangiaceae bacterium]
DEGLGWLEVQRVFRRRARASLYLDRMVAPMLAPTQLTLRRVLLEVDTPFRGQPFYEVQEPLRRWWVARRLREAVVAYYQNARARLKIVYLD